jgi:hypothetical protein
MIITKKINEIEAGNIYYCLLSKKPVLVLDVNELVTFNVKILMWIDDTNEFKENWIISNQLIDYDFLTMKDNDQIT